MFVGTFHGDRSVKASQIPENEREKTWPPQFEWASKLGVSDGALGSSDESLNV